MQHDQCNHTRNEPTGVSKLHGQSSQPHPHTSSEHAMAHQASKAAPAERSTLVMAGRRTRGARLHAMPAYTCQVGRASYPDCETPRTVIPEASERSLHTHIAPPCGLTAQAPNGLLLLCPESEMSCSRCANRSLGTRDTCSDKCEKPGDVFGPNPINLTKVVKVCFGLQGPLLVRASEAAYNARAQLDGQRAMHIFCGSTALPVRPCNPIANPLLLDESYRAWHCEEARQCTPGQNVTGPVSLRS